MSITPKITRSSTLRIAELDLTTGYLSQWLKDIQAPVEAAVRIRVDGPVRGEFGRTTLEVRATWEETE